MPRKPTRKTAASRKTPKSTLPRKTRAGIKSKASSAKPKEPLRRRTVPVEAVVAEPVTLGVGFPVVGVGASAGGLEAFTLLLQRLPTDTGMAFVLVQHLHPEYESALTEILSRATSMPVAEAVDGMAVEPDHVYVIPPNVYLAVLHGVLHLQPRTAISGQNLPIDHFLRSLAEDQGSKATGVILSGAASDGVLGLKAIKGEGGGLLSIGLDVTEKQQLRLEAETHRENLAHLVRIVTLNELASGLAHELSQPLTAITSYTQETLRRLPEGGMVTAATRHALEQTLAQSQRAADIIQHLRNFVGKHTPTKTQTDINHLVRRAMELIGPVIKNPAVAVRLDLAEDLPRVSVDGLQIEQVILNLVQNAIDAMPDTGRARREVTISTSVLSDQHLAVTVSDLGTGLKPEDHDRVFEPFFTTKHKGLGMGLAICRTIIEAHGGTLSVTANRPRGSRFSFTLPMSALNHA